MSTHHSLVLLEGDVIEKLPEIFACFGYKMTDYTETVTGIEAVWERTNWPLRNRPKDTVHKAVLCNGRWTAVLDREMTIISRKKDCEKCAEQFGIKIFGYFSESVSGSCGYYFYHPNLIREFTMSNHEILEDNGDRLPGEENVHPETLIDNGVMLIARHFGFSDTLFGAKDSKVFIVELEFQLESKNLDLSYNPSVRPPQPNKPWWKLW